MNITTSQLQLEEFFGESNESQTSKLWREKEEKYALNFITDTLDIINSNSHTPVNWKVGLTYIATLGNETQQQQRFLIFFPYRNESVKESSFHKNFVYSDCVPYVYLVDYYISVSNEFYFWLCQKNQTSPVVAKLHNDVSGSWELYNGNLQSDLSYYPVNDRFDKYHSNFYFDLNNPMATRIPFNLQKLRLKTAGPNSPSFLILSKSY